MTDMTKTKSTSATSARQEEHVEEIVSSIGPKVKKLRQEQRLSLQQLAVKAEVSAAAIHKIERNDMVPTITTLLKVAAALDHPVTYFVERAGDLPEPVAFTPASERPALFTPHAGLTLAGISGPYAPFRSAAALATVEPGAESGDKPLVHAGEELVFTLEGTVVFDIAGKRHEVGVGDALHFLGDQPHHWVNEGKTEARAVWIALRDS
jgi:transcriptional regulator with XRE-family HTH domain